MDYSYDNNYTTSYGAQGAANGGGFVDGDVQSSQAGTKTGYGKDTVRPLTVKQVLEAKQPHSDADFKVDGEGIHEITFVGQIRGVTVQHTNTTYRVDDGTGIVDVRRYADSEAVDQMEANASKNKLEEDAYCRVYGRLKSFGNKRHVAAHVIRPITDYNEINYHLLEATAVHLFFTRGPPPSDQSGAQAGNRQVDGAGGQDAGANGRSMPGMSPSARRVYTHLKSSSQSNEGLHVQLLASQLGMGVNDVYKAAEELVSNGLIFTTVDDNTWAILDY